MKRARAWAVGLVAILAWANFAIAQERPKQPAAPRLPKDITALRDLPYVEGGHERNRLDLYLPEKAEGRLPLVAWIHGGGWLGGSKENCKAILMATKGYVVASINYRLSQHAVFPAQIEDCKAAIRWLRANAAKFHIDADHIGVWGGSAGGHLVALLGTTGGVKDLEGSGGNLDQTSRVQCVVDWFGPTDFVRWDPNFNKAVYEMIAHLLGGPVQENKEKARRASPLSYVSKDSAPFFIVHGDQDKVVPLNQSETLAEALKKAGGEVTLQVIQGSGHGGPAFGSPENRKLIEDFFAKHLGKGTGHYSEWMLMRDMLSAGVAICDEFPEMYQVAANRFFGIFVPVRNWWYRGHAFHQGSAYAETRASAELYPLWIFARMGAGPMYDPSLQFVPYQWIYMRRPDGQLLRSGDGQSKAPKLRSLLSASYYKDPYVLADFLRDPSIDRHSLLFAFLWWDADLKPRPVSELPLSRYMGSPYGWMVARTGWDAESVIAEMKVNVYGFNNHQHLDAGAFQVYYKGPLAIDFEYRLPGLDAATDVTTGRRLDALKGVLRAEKQHTYLFRVKGAS